MEYDGIKLWWYCEVSMIVMGIVNLYIVICMSKFVFWIEKQKTRSGGNNDSPTSQEVQFTAPGSRNKYKQWMNYMCLMAASQNLFKIAIDQTKFFTAWYARSDVVCELWYDITDIFIFGGIVICVYGFLWLKQWIFYRNPAVEGILYSHHIVTFSKVFVVVILILSSLLTVTNTLAIRYAAGNSTVDRNDTEGLKNDSNYLGCVSIYDMSNVKDSWSLIAYVALASLFQTVLLALFVFPLIQEKVDQYKMKKLMGKNKGCWKSIILCFKDNQDEENNKGMDNLHDPTSTHTSKVSQHALSSIRRSVIWTAICVITDVIFVSTFAQKGSGTPLILVAVVTDLDLLANVLCVIATYSRWRQILFPYLKLSESSGTGSRRKSSIPDHSVHLLKGRRKKKKIGTQNNNVKISTCDSPC